LGVCALLGVAVFAARPHISGVDLTDKRSVTITRTDRGFTPDSIFVTVGTAVTFVNATAGAFWPASDTHPTHTLYAAFDPKAPVPAGASWTFVFDKIGPWSFHDHLHASYKGIIVVLPEGETPSQYVAPVSCSSYRGTDLPACWSAHITDALRSGGVVAAMRQIQRENAADPRFSAACHQFAHQTGLMAYAEDGVHIPFVRELGYCDYGFFHGYMEGFVADHADPADARAFCDAVGKRLEGVDALALPQCNHGIGHGTMEYYLHTRSDQWNDLPGLAREVIAVCEGTNSDEIERFRCASGAYSVLLDWLLQGPQSALFSLERPFALCALEERGWAERGCAWEASKRIRLLIANGTPSLEDFPAALSFIESKADAFDGGAYTSDILLSFSNLLGENNVHSSNNDIIQVCRGGLSSRAHELDCIVGAVQGLLYNAEPERETDRAVAFCLADGLDAEERRACADSVLAFAADSYARSRMHEVCVALSGVSPLLPRAC
jgi:plastocyanin